MVNVCSYKTEERTGTRTVCEYKTEAVKKTVKHCIVTPYEEVVMVPECQQPVTACCDSGRHGLLRR